jgi:uncharacterized protein (DUF427 family)
MATLQNFDAEIAKTKQVVQVKVDTTVLWSSPRQTDQVFGSDGCSYFTFIEYVQPETVAADKFSPTPPSTLISIALYFYPKAVVSMSGQYIAEGNNPDQPGRLVQWAQ